MTEILDGRTLSFAFLAFAVVLGCYGRFRGLGQWSVALDEYHSVMGVRYILETGLPEFPGGGLYMRGLLPTYLAAAIASTGLTDATSAYRWVSALSNIATVPALFLLARAVGGSNVARVVVGLFLLSVLEIETARYARMYAPFQAMFVWQVWLLRELLARPDSKKIKFAMFGLAACGPLVFEGAIFQIAMLFLPCLVDSRFRGVRYLSASTAVLIGTLAFETVGWRRFGAAGEGTQAASAPELSPETGPLLWPNFDVLGLSPVVYQVSALIGLAIACFLLARIVLSGFRSWPLSAMALIAVPLAFVHQPLASGTVLVFCGCFAVGSRRHDVGEVARVLRIPVVVCLLATALWVVVSLVLLSGGGSGGGFMRKMPAVFAGYPQVLRLFVRPWMEQQPITTVLLGLTAFAGAAVALVRGRLGRDYALVLALFAGYLGLVSAIMTPYVHSRYSLFLYPLWLILSVTACGWFCARVGSRLGTWGTRTVAVALVVVGLVSADDISFSHILTVDSYESAFRLTPASARQRTRLDYQSVGEFVQRLPEDAHIISTERKIDFYTDRLDFTFFDRDSPEFQATTTYGGTREIWTDLPVLSTPEEFQEVVDALPGSVFVIYRGDSYPTPNRMERQLEDAPGEVVFRSPDRTLIVKQLR